MTFSFAPFPLSPLPLANPPFGIERAIKPAAIDVKAANDRE